MSEENMEKFLFTSVCSEASSDSFDEETMIHEIASDSSDEGSNSEIHSIVNQLLKDPLDSTEISGNIASDENRGSRPKLLNPLTYILPENETLSSVDELNKMHSNRMAADIDSRSIVNNVTLENPSPCTTSKMLSENEFFVILKCGQGSNEKNITRITSNKNNTTPSENNTTSPKKQISSQKKKKRRRPKKFSRPISVGKMKGRIYQKIWDPHRQLQHKLIEDNAKTVAKKKEPKKVKPREKNIIDLEKPITPLSEKLKQNSVVQTYKHKSKRNKNQKNEKKIAACNDKLYQKIPLPEQNDMNEPNELSVFDFYDEEAEKRRMEREKLEKQLQELKERTCKLCSEVFKDPMDVLRHKREFHATRKVMLSREEIQPYLELEDRRHCPLCFKEICTSGYKSIYIKHVLVHCEPSLRCKVCGMKFKRKNHLEVHESRHIVRPKAVN